MLIIIITLRTIFSNVNLQKLSSHRLHLLFDSGSSIERAHNSTHITSRTNGRQTGNTTTDHKHFTRWHFSGRRDLTGEKSSEMIGCLENGFVAGNIRHRTQCIKHLLNTSQLFNWFILTDKNLLITWARLILGIQSIAKTVAFFLASASIIGLFCAGYKKLINVWLSLNWFISF